MSWKGLAFGALLTHATLWAAARPAFAEDEDPRPRNALSACAAGDVKAGVAILAELYAQTRNPAYVFNQGRCYQQNGQLDPARQRFAEYLRVGKSEPAEDQERARGFIKEIDDALAAQRAHPETSPPPPAAVPPPAPVVPEAPPAPLEGRARAYRITGVALAALGVVAAGTGVYMSLKVRSLENDIEQQFSTNTVVTDPAALQRQLSDGGRYETWQWISYGISIAAFAGAATTLALGGTFSRSPEPTSVAMAPTFSPGSAGGVVRFRF